MNLTLDHMRQHKGCAPGLAWWEATFGEAPVDYQHVLNELAAIDQVAWARWLMTAVGPDESTLRVGQSDAKHVFAAGTVDLVGIITLAGSLVAGGNIYGHTLTVGGLIAAGGSIDVAELYAVDAIVAGGCIMCTKLFTQGSVKAHGPIDASEYLKAPNGTIRSNAAIAAPQISAEYVVAWSNGVLIAPSGSRR